MSTILFATTVGAVAGPNLTDPMGHLRRVARDPPLAGPFLLAAVAYAAAAVSSRCCCDRIRCTPAVARPGRSGLDPAADRRRRERPGDAEARHPARRAAWSYPDSDGRDHDHDPDPHARPRPRPGCVGPGDLDPRRGDVPAVAAVRAGSSTAYGPTRLGARGGGRPAGGGARRRRRPPRLTGAAGPRLALLGLGWSFGLVRGHRDRHRRRPRWTTRARTQGPVDVSIATSATGGGLA